MKHIDSPDELYSELKKMDKENSTIKFSVPGKGRFTLIYGENDSRRSGGR